MLFNWSNQPRPIVALAPMAGYTDSAYRRLVKSLAGNVVVFSEFVSSDALHYKCKKTKKMLAFDPGEQPFIVQIFGKHPKHFAEAAKVVEGLGAAGVDINMGCPARQVISSDHGSALLKNPSLAYDIVVATVAAVKIPVSVKTRLGIIDSDNLSEFAKMIEDAGAQLLTIHGRTVRQAYTGAADYEPIYRVKKILKIPVIGNGDIDSFTTFRTKLNNLDGLMIGRATIGNPWLMSEIVANLRGENFTMPQTFIERLPVILKHCRLAIELKGESVGIREMRKFLALYVRGEPGARQIRPKLVTVETLQEAEKLLWNFANTVI